MRFARTCLPICKARHVVAVQELRDQGLHYLLKDIEVVLIFVENSIVEVRIAVMSISGSSPRQIWFTRLIMHLQNLLVLASDLHK